MVNTNLDETNRYLLSDFQRQKPFASFLPGIAGPLGVPMWAFYVNRGQAIASFGVESKDSPILEFQPANKAYQVTPALGFRTFLKLEGSAGSHFYEPFSARDDEPGTTRVMAVGANELELTETCPALGLKTGVLYFTLPGESIGGLVRRVTLQNLSETPLKLEMLDGLPAVIPYGVNNGLLKEIGRTCEAWMEVFDHGHHVPFYRLRASVIDRAEVETYQAGHFALACTDGGLLPALVDPAVVFESDTAFYRPLGFERQPLSELLKVKQITSGRTPCGFFAAEAALEPGASLTLYSLYGHIAGQELLKKHRRQLSQPAYYETKYREAVALADDLTAAVDTHTSNPIFDAYCRQNFLDNVLRGGWPVLFGDPHNPKVYPIYSRKHGDLERDYNAFLIAPEPYSQGEGSYRDVNQNRRDNVLLNPAAGDSDIRTFMSLIQIDGYNPRTVSGSSFSLTPEQQIRLMAGHSELERLHGLLSKPFTPGQLLRFIADNDVKLPGGMAASAFLAKVMAEAEQHLEAEFFEGYWIDHWEYNLDLVESYLAVYPERQEDLLFWGAGLPFFDSPAAVQPRSRRYVLNANGPRQYGSLVEDGEKKALIAARGEERNWLRTQHGQGSVYRATLFAKMALTALLKFATLDPSGMGIEMEAGRPGWYDALNGLPALFGSGLSESYELLRWLGFLRAAIAAHGTGAVRLPVEAVSLLWTVQEALKECNRRNDTRREFQYWDAVSTAREAYRAATRLGIDGLEQEVALDQLDVALAAFETKVRAGTERAEGMNGGLPPTYFTFTVDEYATLSERDPQGRPYILPKAFTAHPLPPFLEGPVHALRAARSLPNAAAVRRRLYRQVKDSPLFDQQLKMYKVNTSLAALPQDVGRARAFPRGWLENESIWLHMEYKYLLEVLRAGLYTDFFDDFRQAGVPFLDPQVYGRSPLENSSFLASSVHPDPALHGAGFVARLSGSTAEFISMWLLMMAGPRPFFVQDGALCLALRPALPAWLFDEEGVISFRFLGRCLVTYHNLQRLNTYDKGVQVQRCVLFPRGQPSIELPGGVIPAPYAEMVRGGEIERVEVYF